MRSQDNTITNTLTWKNLKHHWYPNPPTEEQEEDADEAKNADEELLEDADEELIHYEDAT